jgi:hypothetical protein
MLHIGGTADVYLPTNTLAALANLAPQVCVVVGGRERGGTPLFSSVHHM